MPLLARALRPLSLALVLGLVLGLFGAPASADGRRMEEIALAWIAAINSGDIERMAAFRAAHRDDSDDNWRERFPRTVAQLGRLEPTDVMIDGGGRLVLLAESSTLGRLRFVFRFDLARTDLLTEISVERDDGIENDLPALELSGAGESAFRDEIDAYLEALAGLDLFSGAVLVARDDEVVFEGAYGLASREFGVANTLATRFDIGSITKDFTRVAIAQLVAEGKLGLDDTVGDHLPDYPNADVRDEVTVRHLFVHASGVGDYFTEEWLATPMGALRDHQDYIEIWGPKPLEFEPGEGQSYSNFGFTILGALIESASGQPYFDYIAEHVFAPAGMQASGFFETDRPEPDVAVGYTWMMRGGDRGDVLRKNIYLEPVVGGPWGKTYCTVRDLWRFWDALSRHRLAPARYTPWILLEGPPPSSGAEASEEPVREVGLGGGGPGLGADLVAEGGWVIIVLANVDPPVTNHLAERLREALRPRR